ncbi:MAG: carbohydrate-binding protein [Verrucomicrobia bacterium]|nr:carbohydrate-binding protein [Verrucomicrobiota bacterium]
MKITTKPFMLKIASLAAALLSGGAAYALPTLANFYPNGTNLLQPASALTVSANSGTGVTNIVVDLTATNLYTGGVVLAHRTSANGLTIVGSSVSTPLSANMIYGATITAYDASGSSTVSETFDTINPSYTWEAEDFDYGGGLHFDAGVNQYAGQVGSAGVDYNNGNTANGNADYRPKGLETENPNSGDSPLRVAYIGTTNKDYNVGWTAGGDWGNYTHPYPAGTYIMFVRVAGGNGPRTECADITLQSGTATTTNTGTFKFGVKGRGWESYDFMPVTDSGGNLVQFTFDGSVCTIRETQNQGSDNMNFFMLVPVPTIAASTVTISNPSPDGSQQFQPSNSFSFTVSSPVNLDLNSVSLQLSATTLFGSNSTALLAIGSGLSYTGNSSSIVVTTPLTTNVMYSALILANDANGVQASYSVSFDTIVPAFTFEAEDWNYGSGQFIDDPAPDAFGGATYDGVAEVDYHRPSGSILGSYNRFGLQTEGAGDTHRSQYTSGTTDYDVGFTTGGDWANYTRSFPSGTYNIFVRAARGNGGTQTDAGKISLVTGDRTQPNQTVVDLGRHDTPSTGGWQTYAWQPVMNNGGFPAQFTGNGNPQTLRYTFDGAGENIGFFMLVPAVGGNPPPYVSSFTPDGTSMFQPSNTVTFVVNSSVGIPQGNVVLNLNGANVSGLSFSGNSTLWNVSCPVKTNGFYTAIVTLTDTAGTSRFTNTFTTFSSASYQFEAEDYDFSNGQYVTPENQVNAYQGLAGVSGVDYFESDPNGPGRSSGNPYRPADSSNIPDATAGDQARDQFTAVSGTDYNIGSFGIGSFANYTRHYPAGAYNVIGRFAEGAGIAGANLAVLTPGVSTNLLGTFTVQNRGWGTWQWQELLDGSGNPVQVSFDGTSAATLRLGGTTGNEVNVNFLMLVAATPKPIITASVSGGNIHVSFPTVNGYSYQVQYKNDLTDASWTSLGSSLSGNNSAQSVNDPTGGNSHRFYRVQVQ